VHSLCIADWIQWIVLVFVLLCSPIEADIWQTFGRYLADIFSGTFVDSLHAFCRLFTEFLKAFCRLFADNLHAVQTFHRLIVIRTLQWINGLISVFFDGGSSLFFAQKFLQQLLLGKACYCC